MIDSVPGNLSGLMQKSLKDALRSAKQLNEDLRKLINSRGVSEKTNPGFAD